MYISVVSLHFALWGPLLTAVRDGPAPNLLCVFQTHPRLSFQSCRCKQDENMSSASISTWTHSPHFHLDLLLILTTASITFRVCLLFFLNSRALSSTDSLWQVWVNVKAHQGIYVSAEKSEKAKCSCWNSHPMWGEWHFSDKVTLTQGLQANSLLQFSLACHSAKVWLQNSTQGSSSSLREPQNLSGQPAA